MASRRKKATSNDYSSYWRAQWTSLEGKKNLKLLCSQIWV